MHSVANKWRFAAVIEQKGRIIRDLVRVDGEEQHHPEGRYFLEWYLNRRRRRQSVVPFENVAEAARRKALELEAIKAGIISAPREAPKVEEKRPTLAAAIETYLDYISHQRSLRTYRTYRYTIDVLLRNSYSKTYVDQVEREDILKFITDCCKSGLGNRTVYDKVVVVLQFFKRFGKTKLLQPSDWPQYVETIRPIYECEEIQAMLSMPTRRRPRSSNSCWGPVSRPGGPVRYLA